MGEERHHVALRRRSFGLLAAAAPALTRAHAFEIEAAVDAGDFRDALDRLVSCLGEAGAPVGQRTLAMIDALADALGLTESIAGGRARLSAGVDPRPAGLGTRASTRRLGVSCFATPIRAA